MRPQPIRSHADNAAAVRLHPLLTVRPLLPPLPLPSPRVEFYKVKYAKLHEVLISTYQNEKLLLDKAKELKSGLENEKHKLEQRVRQRAAVP